MSMNLIEEETQNAIIVNKEEFCNYVNPVLIDLLSIKYSHKHYKTKESLLSVLNDSNNGSVLFYDTLSEVVSYMKNALEDIKSETKILFLNIEELKVFNKLADLCGVVETIGNEYNFISEEKFDIFYINNGLYKEPYFRLKSFRSLVEYFRGYKIDIL